MPHLSLKKILVKNAEAETLLAGLIQQLGAPVLVEDTRKRHLIGKEAVSGQEFEIVANGEILGRVIGPQEARVVADLIQHLVNRELERKTLGNEVLNLYREVNLIYNFSEKLANTIQPAAIARLALEEAGQLIQASGALVALQRKKDQPIELLASQGGERMDFQVILKENHPLRAVLAREQAGIINDLNGKEEGGETSNIEALLHAPLKIKNMEMGAIVLLSDQPVQYTAGELKLLTTIALQSASAIESALLFEKGIREAQEREEAIRKIHEVTTRFVPNEFLRSLGRQHITDITLDDFVEREVTVFFCDIRDYTSLSETMTPEENYRFVKAFNSRMSPIIYENRGFVNQYLGDAIMAIFPERPSDALKAAISMQKTLIMYNEERVSRGRQPLRMGIGLHTGPLILGIIGDQQRMDVATISDTVNTTARIESLTKHYKANILLSEDSLSKLEVRSGKWEASSDSRFRLPTSHFRFRYLGPVQVKGKREPVGIYECFDGDVSQMVDRKLQTQVDFETGLNHFFARRFSEALAAFDRILEINPDDLVVRRFFNKATKFSREKVPEGWTGVEMMDGK